jgi:hypothetical protein
MSRIGITYEEVATAAETILATRKNPTIERIRTELGGTGSNTTISKYLQDWRSKQLLSTQGSLPATTPPDTVHAAVNHVWEQIHEESAIEIKKVQDQARIDIQLAQHEREQALSDRKQIIKEYAELEQQFNQVISSKELLLLDFKTLQQNEALLKEKYQALEKHHQAMKEQMEKRILDLQQSKQEQFHQHQHEIVTLVAQHKQSIDQLTAIHDDARDQQKTTLVTLKMEIEKKERFSIQQEENLQQLKITLAEENLRYQILLLQKEAAISDTLAKDQLLKAQEIQEEKYIEVKKILLESFAFQKEIENRAQERLDAICQKITDQTLDVKGVEHALLSFHDLFSKLKLISASE